MNFYFSAEDYYKSAICIIQAQESGTLQMRFPLVAYYLFSHAVAQLMLSVINLRNLWLYLFLRSFLLTPFVRKKPFNANST
jgi:hypothetical protein